MCYKDSHRCTWKAYRVNVYQVDSVDNADTPSQLERLSSEWDATTDSMSDML